MTFGDGIQEIPQRQPLYDRMAVLILKALEESGSDMSSKQIYEATLCRSSPTMNGLVWFLKRMASEGKVIKIRKTTKKLLWGLPR